MPVAADPCLNEALPSKYPPLCTISGSATALLMSVVGGRPCVGMVPSFQEALAFLSLVWRFEGSDAKGARILSGHGPSVFLAPRMGTLSYCPIPMHAARFIVAVPAERNWEAHHNDEALEGVRGPADHLVSLPELLSPFPLRDMGKHAPFRVSKSQAVPCAQHATANPLSILFAPRSCNFHANMHTARPCPPRLPPSHALPPPKTLCTLT